jgi:hypothetical protein
MTNSNNQQAVAVKTRVNAGDPQPKENEMSWFDNNMKNGMRTSLGKHLKSAAATAAAIILAAWAAGPAAAAAAAAAPNPPTSTQNVNVVNTPTVNVGNTPTVTLANGASVGINGTAVFRNIDEPGRSPYQAQVTGTSSVNCSGGFSCSFTFTAVPAGHRLVVQHVTMFIQPIAGSVPARVGLLSTTLPTFVGPMFFATVQGGPPNYSNSPIVFDQQVTAYYDDGDNPKAFIDGISINLGIPASNQVATLIGYLVDCGAASSCSPIVR